MSGKAKITKIPKPRLTEYFEKMAAKQLTVRVKSVRVKDGQLIVEYEAVPSTTDKGK